MLILIPIFAMLALEFIIPGKKGICARCFFFILGGTFFLFLLTRSFLPVSLVNPEGEAVVRARSQVLHLLKHREWQKHPVIILMGSSVTQYAVNGVALERSLEEAGKPVTVLQFSFSGANHFERLFMLRFFLQEIGATHREELKKAPTLLMCEVLDTYDESPLYLFKKEAYTRRAMAWFEPHEACAACKAWKASGRDDGVSYWMLWEHFLLNRFAVGNFSSFEPPRYNKSIEPFFPLTGTKKSFHYDEMEKRFQTEKESVFAPTLCPGWKSFYQTLFEEMSGTAAYCSFYALPTLELQRRAYQKAFAAALPPHTTMIGPPTRSTMQSLLHQEYWFDGVHPKDQGAVLVTRWLADEIVKQWDSLFETRWSGEL